MKRARSRSATWLVVFGLATCAAVSLATAQRPAHTRARARAAPVSEAPVVDPALLDSAAQAPTEASAIEPDPEPAPEVDPDDRPIVAVQRNALMAYPLAWVGRAFAAAYERALPDARFSLLARLSFAAPAGGDYASRHVGFSIESRFYVLGRGPFTRWAAPAPVGLYVGARVGVTHIALRDTRTDRQVGTLSRLGFEASTGYRFVAFEHLELTPYVGALFYTDVVDGLVLSFRPTMTFGFTVGGTF